MLTQAYFGHNFLLLAGNGKQAYFNNITQSIGGM